MAGASGITHQELQTVIERTLALPINRSAAAALTVAFEIRKAGHLSRGETVSDDLIAQEIQAIYFEMMALTDPAASMAKARGKVQAAKVAADAPRMPPNLSKR